MLHAPSLLILPLRAIGILSQEIARKLIYINMYVYIALRCMLCNYGSTSSRAERVEGVRHERKKQSRDCVECKASSRVPWSVARY